MTATKTKTAAPSRSLAERALDAIPGYREAAAGLDMVKWRLGALRASAEDPDQAVARVRREAADEIASTGKIPADLGARLVAARAGGAERQAEIAALGTITPTAASGIAGHLRNDRERALADGADFGLAVLRAELDEVLAETRRLDGILGAAASADDAVAHGGDKPEAWRALSEVVGRYDELRQSQARFAAAGLGHDAATMGHMTRQLLEHAGYVSNLIDLDPLQLEPPRKAAAGGHSPEANVMLARTPWPSPRFTDGSSHWPTTDRPAYLRWLADSEAEPWLPSIAQLQAKRAEMDEAVREAQADTRVSAGHAAGRPRRSGERERIRAGVASRRDQRDHDEAARRRAEARAL